MTIRRKLASWLSWLPWYRRQERDADLARELRDHLELEAAEQQEIGLSPEEASNAAHRALGNTLKIEEDVRAAWGFQWLETFAQDIRYGLRMLCKSPGFTTVAILTLALGIGANTAIFSVIDAVLLSPLPYPKSLQLIAARPNDSLPNVIEIQRRNHSFLQGGAINVTPMDFTRAAGPVRIHAGLVNAGFLETLGISPMLGRIISSDEDVEGGPRNIVASYQFWRDFLNGDPHALGRTVTLNGNSYSVIGVMPASFQLPREHADVFISLWVADPSAARSRDVHFLHPYWRLKPGVTLAHAQADILSIDQSLAQQYPDDERGRKTSLMPLHQMLVGDVRPALLVLFGAVALVLLIACANFAGLLMARAATRRHELVIRAALGARRSRLIRQALTESGLLAIVGGVAGLLLAKSGTSLLLSLKPAALERFSGIQMDVNVLLFVFGVSMLTGVVFGLVPAWSAARADVSESLKESGRSATAGPSGHLLRKLLVTAEFAIALVLLVGAGLLIRGFSRLRSVNPGFNPANVMTMYLELSSPRYGKIPLQMQFRRELLSRLNSFPGVEAAMISDIPFGGNYVGHRAVFDGRPPVPAGAEPMVQTLSVMGDYFHVMQIPIHEGRGFSPADREGEPLVAIVNEEFMRDFFPGGSPLGHRIAWAGSDGPYQWMTIVGVVADVKHSGLDQPTDPAVYTPFSQNDEAWRRFMTLAIRARGAPTGLVEAVKKQVWSMDSQIPVSDVQSMEDLMSVSLAQQWFNLVLLGIFAALALILASVGIYGLMAYVVSQRTHEIGIRMALGAQRRDVLRIVVRDGAKLAFAGIVIGVLGALALTRLMTSLLFEVKPTDPVTIVAVAILLGLVALAACYIPARRAMRVDPMVALRYE